MTKITINKVKTINDDIPGLESISFDYLGKKVYSASKIDRIVGVFLSDVLTSVSTFIRWDSVIWSGTSTNRNIAIYVRNAQDSASLLTSSWSGPFYDKSFDISSMDLPYLQFMIILVANDDYKPIVDSFTLKFISSQNSVKFFSRLFYLGFSPKDIMLTYNAEEDNDSIIRFAVAIEDTTDESKYQFIDPNKLQSLVNLSPTADSIKLMIEIAGNSGVPTQIHELALTVGGEGAERINKIPEESSSSSSSSSST